MTAIAKKSVDLHEVIVTYDFAVHGGAIGTIDLDHGLSKGCSVWGGYARVLTALTGATATAALQLEAANDIISEAAISGAPWSTTGNKQIVPVPQTVATYVTTTVDRNLSLVVGTAALTAGKVEVHLFYSQNINTLS